MELIEKVLEMRAVRRDEIIKFFIGINGKETGYGQIAGDGWDVEVGRESSVDLGPFAISSVKVTLRCEKKLFDQIYYEFCLKFFHAGG